MLPTPLSAFFPSLIDNLPFVHYMPGFLIFPFFSPQSLLSNSVLVFCNNHRVSGLENHRQLLDDICFGKINKFIQMSRCPRCKCIHKIYTQYTSRKIMAIVDISSINNFNDFDQLAVKSGLNAALLFDVATEGLMPGIGKVLLVPFILQILPELFALSSLCSFSEGIVINHKCVL